LLLTAFTIDAQENEPPQRDYYFEASKNLFEPVKAKTQVNSF
jgi:hypothetical protein